MKEGDLSVNLTDENLMNKNNGDGCYTSDSNPDDNRLEKRTFTSDLQKVKINYDEWLCKPYEAFPMSDNKSKSENNLNDISTLRDIYKMN